MSTSIPSPPRAALSAVLLLATAVAAAAAPAAAQQSEGRVIVLGMDGLDASMAADWMDAGELPNLARLREQGTFAPLMPANPAQSPVSWATLNTGRNPGKHGIFDFIGIQRSAAGSSPVSPTVGFQEPRSVTPQELGLRHANPTGVWLIMGGGVLAGAVIVLLLRRRLFVGLPLGLAVAGGTLWFHLPWLDAYPSSFNDYTSLNRADDFWIQLDEAGIPFRGQGTIVSYPVRELEHGKVVAGLGAPDATGGLNSSAIYTTAEERQRRRKTYEPKPAWAEEDAPSPSAPSGGDYGTVKVYALQEEGGVWTSKLFGPLNTWKVERYRERRSELGETLRTHPASDATEEYRRLEQLLGNTGLLRTWVPMEVEWSPGAAAATITVDGVAQEVPMNSWSGFYRVEFPWNARFSTHAMVRLWAEEVDGALELFASPLQIDPEHPTPGSRICWPPEFAAEVAGRIGEFETLGWACQTHAVKDAELSDRAFLADIEFTYEWRRRMLEDAMQDPDWKVLFHFFGSPDRVCHMLMRHMDPEHPQHDPALAAEEVDFFGEPVALEDSGLAIYRKMDEAVGWLLDEAMQPQDVLLIVSDHGFSTFRRQVNLNNWLVHEGFATLDDRNRIGQARSADQMDARALRWMDWEESRAYSVAISKIYLNLAGREAQGIVTPEEADAVTAEIVDRLYEMTDPESGEKIVQKVWLRDEIYSGPYAEAGEGHPGAPELTVDFVPGYRAAWSVTSGGIALEDGTGEDGETIAVAGPAVSDNPYAWSGDHCGVHMAEVQGVFFSSRPMGLPQGATHYDATHLAPTVLALQGVPRPDDYDAAPLAAESDG